MNEQQQTPIQKFRFIIRRGNRKLTEFEFGIPDCRMSQIRELLTLEQWLNNNTDVRIHIEQESSDEGK